VNCPGDIAVQATNTTGATVSYSASATDPCGIAFFNCSPPSGSVFPLGATVANRRDGENLDDAIEHLTRSVDSDLWIDQIHLPRKGGEKVFDEEKKAVHELVELLKAKKSTVADADLRALIDCILRADRLLAVVAVDEA